MDLYQIFITHNRSWSVRETIIFFLLLFLIVGLLLRQLKYGKLEKTQFFAVIALYVFVSIVFGSTVFTRTSGKRMYELIPFWSWRKVIFEHDFMLLEENLLNMLLFVPIGGLLELCLKRIKWKQRRYDTSCLYLYFRQYICTENGAEILRCLPGLPY